ncbi:MAG: tetratricopeptide repeat protein [Cyanobacteria bacterium J06643_5]
MLVFGAVFGTSTALSGYFTAVGAGLLAVQTVSGIAGSISTSSLIEWIKSFRQNRKILDDNHLTQAVGRAISLVILDVANREDELKKFLDEKNHLYYKYSKKELAKRVGKLAKKTEENWLKLSKSQIDDNTETDISESDLVTILTNDTENFHTIKALDIDAWSEILWEISELAKVTLHPDVITFIASKLYHEFPQKFRGVLKHDADKGGEAFAQMLLNLHGEALAALKQVLSGNQLLVNALDEIATRKDVGAVFRTMQLRFNNTDNLIKQLLEEIQQIKLQSSENTKNQQYSQQGERIFISYKRDAQPDEKVALQIAQAHIYKALCNFICVNWEEVSINEAKIINSLKLNFIGRESDIINIHNFVLQENKIIFIWAEGGTGKTELSFQYLKLYRYTKILKIIISTETSDIIPVESIVLQWLQDEFDENTFLDFDANLSKLRKILKNSDDKIGIIIDNLENILDKNHKFVSNYRSYSKLLKILADSELNSTTIITSRELLCEPSIKFISYKLKGLEVKDWVKYFRINENSTDYTIISEIRNAYNGNALAMKIFRNILEQDYGQDIKLCWNHYQDKLTLNQTIQNLIEEQFQRIEKNNPIAYNLLCRIGCYRYQSISAISFNELKFLLWEEPEKVKETIEFLKNCSLLEHFKGNYSLHPFIKAEAIRRLKNRPDWKITNTKIAIYFSENIEVIKSAENALFVLESCYHYIQIQDLTNAALVLVKDRSSPYEKIESLGVALYRLGLFSIAIPIALQLIKSDITEYLKCRIYNILGEFYLTNGELNSAIKYYESSKEIAKYHIEDVNYHNFSKDKRRTFKNLYIASFYNIGISYLELWELDKARKQFNRVKSFYQNKESFSPYIYGSQLLGDIYCPILLGENLNSDAKQQFYKIVNSFPDDGLIDFSNPWALGFLGIICGLVYLYLDEYDKSQKIFTEILTKTIQMNYQQFQANALNSLAILNRQKYELKEAIIKHEQAISLLEKLECHYDIAEAYFQAGLTYKSNNNSKESTRCFQKATNIFNKISAPKQIQRVNQAINNSKIQMRHSFSF